MAAVDGFVEAMTGSPVGVTLLALLESRTRRREGFALSLETSPASVASAVEMVEMMSFGAFADLAVLTGVIHVGPWISDAPSTAAAAYHQAAARLPIAEAVAERFGDELHAPLDHAAQQWWTDGAPGIESLAPLFDRFDNVYGAGEFTWSGLWTATDPPPEALAQMVGAWELETGPITRWWLPVRPEAHVYEIHRPEDWARLVTAHPRQALPHPGWELPGINQHHHHISALPRPGARFEPCRPRQQPAALMTIGIDADRVDHRLVPINRSRGVGPLVRVDADHEHACAPMLSWMGFATVGTPDTWLMPFLLRATPQLDQADWFTSLRSQPSR